MKLFWKNNQGEQGNESILLTEPAAKLASIEFRDGAYFFKCLGVYEKLAVGTLRDAKTLAEMRLGRMLREIASVLTTEDIPDETVPDARTTRNG